MPAIGLGGVGDPLMIAVRVLHFASTMLVAGVAMFSVLIVAPVWRRSESSLGAWAELHRKQTAGLIWFGLVVAVASDLGLVALGRLLMPWERRAKRGGAMPLAAENESAAVA